MGDDRAPGHDGFTAAFFKKAWDVVTTPSRINDYRPISCCNVLYKCISKIIANRLKKGASYSISVNGNVYGWFKGKRGLRQGDPLSLYLFNLVNAIPNLIVAAKGSLYGLNGFTRISLKVVVFEMCLVEVMPIGDGMPLDWLSRFPFLAQLHVHVLLDDMDDVILWRDRDGVLRPFLVACVWDTIRSRVMLSGSLTVFPACHSYVVGYSAEVEDTRQAVTMGCRFEYRLKPAKMPLVWSKVRVLCGMDAIPPHLSDVVAFIVPLSKGKTVVNIISRIVVTFKFKKMSTKSRLLLDLWKIPSFCIVHDGSTRQPYLDLYCSYRIAAGLQDARLIICSHIGLCLV
ncbi:hypothetical protein Tco_1345801 [Tanacetum coccineum]